MENTYEQACRAAATEQGLDPVTEALAAAGIPAEVEQTGGMTMVVVVEVVDGVVGITADGEDDSAPYLVVHYVGTTWEETYGDEDADAAYDLSAAEVVAMVDCKRVGA